MSNTELLLRGGRVPAAARRLLLRWKSNGGPAGGIVGVLDPLRPQTRLREPDWLA